MGNIKDDVIDISELKGFDNSVINPDVYIHYTLVAIQKALQGENTTGDKLIQFRMLIEWCETLCKAKNVLPDDYADQLKKYKGCEDYKDEKESTIKSFKLANQKALILLTQVFKSRVVTDTLFI